MKALSITGFVLSVLSFITGLYLQLILAPAVDSLKASLDTGMSDEINSMMFMAAHEAKVNTAEMLIIVSGIALILSAIPAFKKKSKLAWTGTILGLLSLIIGVVHGTHMFS